MIARRFNRAVFGAAISLAFGTSAAEETATQLDPIQVTATRTGETLDQVPMLVSVVSGDDIRARGATDLRSALAGVAGVEISAGGDGGPAGAVPALWGLREVDAFLLVVDGVPSGGAFNPALTTLDLTSIERIEVLRGSAPVMYGATSFVGVIHVIHYAAGKTPSQVSVAFGGPKGNIGSTIVSASTSFGGGDSWGHSISVDGEKRNFADDDAGFSKGHGLYRTAGKLGAGTLHVDVDLTKLEQDPDSPVVREGTALTTKTPRDANHNPADARFEETRGQLNVGYSMPIGAATWDTLASLDHTKAETLRGFLGNADTGAAAGYEQERKLDDVYLDSHISFALAQTLNLSLGFDALAGKVKQESGLFSYVVNPDGSDRPDSDAGTPIKEGESEVERRFLGLYVQSDWHLTPTVDLLAGLRVNSTHEKRDGEAEEDDGEGGVVEVQAEESESKTRLSGMLGGSWKFWQGGAGEQATLYANWRNTFKPAAFEFGPENEAEIPRFETANSYEAGIKTSLAQGRVDVDFSAFDMDFKNVFLQEGNDIRKTRLRGAEAEARWLVIPQLLLAASETYHDSTFRNATINDGADDVSGNDLELAPHWLTSVSALYNPADGLFASTDVSFVGSRFLNKRNTAKVDGYTTIDASIGYRIAQLTVALTGHNLGDRRDPVSESEFSEVVAGASSYYRLPARVWMLSASYDFGGWTQ